MRKIKIELSSSRNAELEALMRERGVETSGETEYYYTKKEVLKALPKAKTVLGYVHITTNDGSYIELKKTDAIYRVKQFPSDEDIEFKASMRNGIFYFN